MRLFLLAANTAAAILGLAWLAGHATNGRDSWEFSFAFGFSVVAIANLIQQVRLGRRHADAYPITRTRRGGLTDRQMLRHTLATLAYRCGKAVRGAPPDFAQFRASPTSRTPVEILAHIGDLLDWMLSLARGAQTWNDATPQPWPDEVARFFTALKKIDDYLASDAKLDTEVARLFQGPVADALTHTGQIAMLRRMHGAPIRGENYTRAGVVVGRVGADQEPAGREFE